MATFRIEAKDNFKLDQKPSVYFTCHPDDFEQYFSRVCEDIFKTHNCKILYVPNEQASPQTGEELENDLGRVNLIVIPVTLSLLTTPNRAMDLEIPYAKKAHIPILPLMMEPGLDVLYGRPDKFGTLQYLTPSDDDTTAIAYEEKLKKHLEMVLVDEKLMQQIRDAFDGYIFLSYRKVDRKYANDLMRAIHRQPQYRNIAIWFDEFLTPGRNFNQDIFQNLSKSRLFMLVVTPNLLDTPNFVADEEYPAAKELNLPILPVEMADTNKAMLSALFENMPRCRKLSEATVWESLQPVAENSPKNAANYRYLMGMAYLNGIDVERNSEYALTYLTSAAQEGHGPAMHELYLMHSTGHGVAIDYQKAVFWHEKFADYVTKGFGQEHATTIHCRQQLAWAYLDAAQYEKALETLEQIYPVACRVFGKDHPDALGILIDWAGAYEKVGQYEKALELQKENYALCRQSLGEEHYLTINALNGIAVGYYNMCQYEKGIKASQQVYKQRCKVLGNRAPATITALNNLAMGYSNAGNQEKALELEQQVYDMRYKLHGPESYETTVAMENLGTIYLKLGQKQRALEMFEKAYQLYAKVLGEQHPNVLKARNGAAMTRIHLGEDATEALQEGYDAYCRILGADHPDTLVALSLLADAHMRLGHVEKSCELGEKLYAARSAVLGEKHLRTNQSFQRLSNWLWDSNRLQQMAQLYETQYDMHKDDYTKAIRLLEDLEFLYKQQKDSTKALDAAERIYAHKKAELGADHPDVPEALQNACYRAEEAKDNRRVAELREEEYLHLIQKKGEDLFTLNKLRNVAACYQKAQLFEKALALYQRAKEIALSEESASDVSYAEEGMANVYKDMGEYEKALALLKKICVYRYERFEGEYAFVYPFVEAVAQCCEKLGRFAQAKEAKNYLQIEQERLQKKGVPMEPEAYEELLEQCAKDFPDSSDDFLDDKK